MSPPVGEMPRRGREGGAPQPVILSAAKNLSLSPADAFPKAANGRFFTPLRCVQNDMTGNAKASNCGG